VNAEHQKPEAGGSPVDCQVRPLVERLRAYPADELLSDDYSTAMLEAADEIERLRECLQWLQARHHGGLMRATIDEALGARRVEQAGWSDGWPVRVTGPNVAIKRLP